MKCELGCVALSDGEIRHNINCQRYAGSFSSLIDEYKAKLDIAVRALKWYAEWDWTDKYVQAIPTRAKKALSQIQVESKENK